MSGSIPRADSGRARQADDLRALLTTQTIDSETPVYARLKDRCRASVGDRPCWPTDRQVPTQINNGLV